MKRWLKWGLWVLVPLTVYVGGYYACCVWPRGMPLVQQHGAQAGRAVNAVFGPLMLLHRDFVERRSFAALEGRWSPLGGGEHATVEFRRPEVDGEEMVVRMKAMSSGEVRLGVLEWVPGTARVGVPGMGLPAVEFVLEGEGRMAVHWPGGGVLWSGGASGEVFVREGARDR